MLATWLVVFYTLLNKLGRILKVFFSSILHNVLLNTIETFSYHATTKSKTSTSKWENQRTRQSLNWMSWRDWTKNWWTSLLCTSKARIKLLLGFSGLSRQWIRIKLILERFMTQKFIKMARSLRKKNIWEITPTLRW